MKPDIPQHQKYTQILKMKDMDKCPSRLFTQNFLATYTCISKAIQKIYEQDTTL